jgi:MoaA/NifB/PqqE/SkfB family radical SAM enzyme
MNALAPPVAASALDAHINAAPLTAEVQAALRCHLANPTLAASELAHQGGVSVPDVMAAYALVRTDDVVQAHVRSLLYANRLRTAFAAATVTDWLCDPDRVRSLLAGEAVLSRTVELHPSKGTCTYRCSMCLWSDQDQLTYTTRDLRGDGLVATDRWCRLLDELHAGGARTVVVSGGGEALLNRELPVVLRHARQLALAVHIYTTGFHLGPDRTDLVAEVAQAARVRFSIHSPRPDTYDQITGLPSRLHALARVTDNVAALLAERDRRHSPVRVGMGFVAQPANIGEIAEMADFAAALGVDFLDIRKDEVDVTGALSPVAVQTLRTQVASVRRRALAGDYGRLDVDIGDELIALANGEEIDRSRTSECLAKYFRPAISPYGAVAPCDLTAEPRFARTHLTLGHVDRTRLPGIVADMANQPIPDACAQCMPSSRTGNAVYHKLHADLRAGIDLTHQPFPSGGQQPAAP